MVFPETNYERHTMAEPTEEDTAAAEKAQLDKLEKVTKRGFDLSSRLKNRGLRRGSITLFLDEDLGPKLGWAYDVQNEFKQVIGRERAGVIGNLDAQEEMLRNLGTNSPEFELTDEGEKARKKYEVELAKKRKALQTTIDALIKERDELIEELTKSAIHIEMRAVPPIIQKDTHRRAKITCDLDGKNIPENMEELVALSESAHLMTVMFQSVTDNETGETNTETTYQDAIDLMGYLPPGQMARLDMKMGEIQFTDAISRAIETQEDFS